MKTILFPTDFSDNAGNALPFALEIAQKSHSKLILFNAFWVPVYEFDNPPETRKKERKFRSESLKELGKLENKIKADYPRIETEILVSNGFTAEAITNAASNVEADLIVMGTKGATGLRELIMGSNTVDVISKATCAVLAIPEEAKMTKFVHLVFASNFSEYDTEEIKFLIELGQLFDSRITITHVTEEDFIIETADQVILKKLKRDVKVKTRYEKLSYKLLKGDVIDELNEYIKAHNVDLLSMVTSKKHFLSKIFNKSFTHKMAFHTEVPLLVLHSPAL